MYQCKPLGFNDWVYITTSRGNSDHWGRPMRLIGRNELIDDPRFATGRSGRARGRGGAEVLRDWLGIGAGEIVALKSEGVDGWPRMD